MDHQEHFPKLDLQRLAKEIWGPESEQAAALLDPRADGAALEALRQIYEAARDMHSRQNIPRPIIAAALGEVAIFLLTIDADLNGVSKYLQALRYLAIEGEVG